MYLLHMRPKQIQEAIRRNIPVIMGAGVIEYHGPHLPIGTDILAPIKIIEEVEKRCECIVAPELPYGPTLNWAGGIHEGDIDFNVCPLFLYAVEVFKQLLQMGFRRIYIVQYHQGGGEQQLALRLAARKACGDFARKWGSAWGVRDDRPSHANDILNCIQIKNLWADKKPPRDSDEKEISLNHAGKGETELIMGTMPELVDISSFVRDKPNFGVDAGDSSEAAGTAWIEYCVKKWVNELK